MPQSRILTFRNKQTWLTLLGPKLMFWCLSYYLGAFGTVSMPFKTRFKMSRSGEKFVPWSRVGILRNESSEPPHWTLTSCFCAFRTIWVHFWTVWLHYKTRCKTGQISAKVGATKSRRNFSQECTRSTPLDSKLMFWCVSYHLGAFGTIWVHLVTLQNSV